MLLNKMPWSMPSEICLSVDKIWYYKDYKRLIFGAFEHGDDFHLYYNMLSFMWKGIHKIQLSIHFVNLILLLKIKVKHWRNCMEVAISHLC